MVVYSFNQIFAVDLNIILLLTEVFYSCKGIVELPSTQIWLLLKI